MFVIFVELCLKPRHGTPVLRVYTLTIGGLRRITALQFLATKNADSDSHMPSKMVYKKWLRPQLASVQPQADAVTLTLALPVLLDGAEMLRAAPQVPATALAKALVKATAVEPWGHFR